MSADKATPPRRLLQFFRWFCDPDLVEDLEGDMIELFEERHRTNKLKAKTLFALEVLLLMRPGIFKDLEGNKNLNSIGMTKNYVKSAWRNVMKHKTFSTINIFSLTVGLAACMVIFLFIRDERSFDSFHSKKENIYRLCEVQSFPGTNTQKVALSMSGMGPTMIEEFPEIENFTRFLNFGEQLIELEDRKITVEQVVGVDSTFLSIFDYKLISGNPKSVLEDPLQAVLSEEMAIKLYNRLDIIGEMFTLDDQRYVINGVIENTPEKSHLQYDIMISLKSAATNNPNFDSQFGNNFLNTYLLLHEDTDTEKLTEQFPDYMVRMMDNPNINEIYQLFLQPLDEVHLGSSDIEHDYNNHRKFNGTYLGIFTMVGIFILIIASLNFMNLTTARAGSRAKEVGVRKTIGALRFQLFNQFITESIFLAILALILALVINLAAIPLLNQLIERQLSIVSILTDPLILTSVLLITVIIGILAGVYPSLYLSAFKPVVVLKGFKTFEKKSIFRTSLVIVQFSLALGMIISTLVVIQQLSFMKNKDVGFQKEHIVLANMNPQSNDKYKEMKRELLNESTILGVTASGQRLGNNFHQWGYKYKNDTGVASITPSSVWVDYDFLDVYGIELLQGRTFSREYASDDGLAFIINEAFAEELGFENPLNVKLGHGWYPNDSLGSVIGVTENFNFNSLHFKVNTLAMVVHDDWDYNEMSIKISGENVKQALDDIERVYASFVPDYPISYEFLDEHFETLYKSDQQMGYVITIIAVLSITIGCLGLFGLASISVQRRIKEVGIRKVMGASTNALVKNTIQKLCTNDSRSFCCFNSVDLLVSI